MSLANDLELEVQDLLHRADIQPMSLSTLESPSLSAAAFDQVDIADNSALGIQSTRGNLFLCLLRAQHYPNTHAIISAGAKFMVSHFGIVRPQK